MIRERGSALEGLELNSAKTIFCYNKCSAIFLLVQLLENVGFYNNDDDDDGRCDANDDHARKVECLQ